MDDYQIKNFLKFAPARLGLAPKKHLFIHIPKNGGMSIRCAEEIQSRIVIANRRRLKSRKYADELLHTMNAAGDHPGYEHARLRDIDLSVRNACIPFAIVRNPWARVVSRFTFGIQVMDSNKAPEGYIPRSFEAFVDQHSDFANKDYFWHRAVRGWYPQSEYVVDEVGGVPVNILRLESIDDELSAYFGLSAPLEKRNVTSKNFKNSEFYNAKTIQIVADIYHQDINRFGFDFNGTATRNTFYADLV